MNEPVLVVAEQLRHATLGYNALRTLVPRDLGTDPPPAALIADSVTASWVRRNVIDRARLSEGPIILVNNLGDADTSTDAKQDAEKAEWDVGIRIAVANTREDSTYRELGVWCDMAFRVVKRSLSLLWPDAGVQMPVQRNQINLWQPRIRFLGTSDAQDDCVIIGALIVSWPFIDTWALGIDPA